MDSEMGKIVSKETFKNEIRPKLKNDGRTIALCHGVFDISTSRTYHSSGAGKRNGRCVGRVHYGC